MANVWSVSNVQMIGMLFVDIVYVVNLAEEQMRQKLGTAGGATIADTTENENCQNQTATGENTDNADADVSSDDVSFGVFLLV